MATVQIRTHGNPTWEGVEFENFATEETLKALLDQFRAFATGLETTTTSTNTKNEKSQSRVEKLLAGLGGGITGAAVGSKLHPVIAEAIGPALDFIKPFSGLIEGLEVLTPEILLAVVAFKLVSGAVTVFQTGLNLVSRTITSIFSVAGNLVNTFLSGKKTMVDYFDAVARGTASIPIIGTFTSLLASGAAILNRWNDTLFELNTMGAGFGNSVASMIASAAATGQSLDQYAQVIKNNISNLSSFGSVIEGVKTYTAVANISMNEYANQIAGLGISLDQYQTELPGILSLFGASMKASGSSNRDLALAALDLTTNFTELSKITGKTREQQLEDTKRLTQDAAWRNFINQNAKDAEKYTAAVAQIQAASGDSFAELYKLSVLGMPPLTKELQILMATTPGLTDEFKRMTDLVKEGNPKLAGYGKQMDSIVADIVSSGISTGQSFSTLLSAATAGLGGTPEIIAKIQKELLERNTEFIKNGHLDRVAFIRIREQARQEAQTQDEINASLNKFSIQASKLQSDFFRMVVVPLLDRLAPVIATITKTFENNSDAIKSIIDKIVEGINEFGGWLVTHRQDIQQDIQDFMGIMVTVFKVLTSITKFLIEHWDTIKTILVAAGIAVVALGVIVGAAGLGLILPALATGLGTLTSIVTTVVKALSGESVLGTLTGAGAATTGGASTAAVATTGAGTAALASEGAVAGGSSILGLGEGGAALGGIMTGEAMIPGIGWAALGATALAAGGIYAWKKYAEHKEKDRKEAEKLHHETTKVTKPDHGETLNNIHDALQDQHETLMQIARNTSATSDNTAKTSKYNRTLANTLGS